jgi:hypothetical protein
MNDHAGRALALSNRAADTPPPVALSASFSTNNHAGESAVRNAIAVTTRGVDALAGAPAQCALESEQASARRSLPGVFFYER